MKKYRQRTCAIQSCGYFSKNLLLDGFIANRNSRFMACFWIVNEVMSDVVLNPKISRFVYQWKEICLALTERVLHQMYGYREGAASIEIRWIDPKLKRKRYLCSDVKYNRTILHSSSTGTQYSPSHLFMESDVSCNPRCSNALQCRLHTFCFLKHYLVVAIIFFAYISAPLQAEIRTVREHLSAYLYTATLLIKYISCFHRR